MRAITVENRPHGGLLHYLYDGVLQQVESLFTFQIARFRFAAMSIFEFSRRQAAVADHQPVRDTKEFGIGKFDPWPGVTIIKQNLETRIR